MDIHIPVSAALILVVLALLAFVFIGYQLDDIYRRMKEFESVGTYDVKEICDDVLTKVERSLKDAELELNRCFNKRVEEKVGSFLDQSSFSKRIESLEERFKPRPKGKRGRPRKVVDGHTH